jgi:amidase
VTDIHDLSAIELGLEMAGGRLSPVEVTQHYLNRIAERDDAIGAFITVTADLAVGQAKQAEHDLLDARQTGRTRGPLHGVPIAIKDTVHVEDVRCTFGSVAFTDHVSDLDDHVVTRIKDAGMVILGKTNTPEFALPCYTENLLRSPTRNPWDLSRSPGGSSGGSASAVAAGMSPLGHGTDGGGSVRIPASACGLVGIKPSRGRVSNGPSTSHEVAGLSSQGALGRTVADAAALLGAMSGLMPGDVYSAPAWSTPSESRELRPLRIAVVAEPMLPDVVVHPDCVSALEKTAGLLSDLGHEIDETSLSPDQHVADLFQLTWSIIASCTDLEDEDDEAELSPFTRYLRELGRSTSGPDLYQALRTFRGVGQMLTDLVFANYDVLLTPTLAQPPALIGEFSSDDDPAADFARMSAFMPFTPI